MRIYIGFVLEWSASRHHGFKAVDITGVRGEGVMCASNRGNTTFETNSHEE
jgi:hypothetical protein